MIYKNSAHVIFTNEEQTVISPAVYLYHHGGPENVYSFLAEIDRRKCGDDANCMAALFVQVAANHIIEWQDAFALLRVENGPAEITPTALVPFSYSDSQGTNDNGAYIIRLHGDEWAVQRFVCGNREALPKELTPRQVEAERTNAIGEIGLLSHSGVTEKWALTDVGREHYLTPSGNFLPITGWSHDAEDIVTFDTRIRAQFEVERALQRGEHLRISICTIATTEAGVKV